MNIISVVNFFYKLVNRKVLLAGAGLVILLIFGLLYLIKPFRFSTTPLPETQIMNLPPTPKAGDFSCQQELSVCKNVLNNTIKDNWRFYRDERYNFYIKYQDPYEISHEEFIDYLGFNHYYVELGYDLSIDISDTPISKVRANLPTNFDFQKENISLEKYVKIPAEKYTALLAQELGRIEFLGYLIFEVNDLTFEIKYHGWGGGEADKAIFDEIIDSFQYHSGIFVPRSELKIMGGENYYTDINQGFTVQVPWGWTVWRSDTSDGYLTLVSNRPINKSFGVRDDSDDNSYTNVYIGHGLIFSTSGALCANTRCDNAGKFLVKIKGKTYETDILDHPNGGYRFSFEVSGLTYTASFYSQPYSPMVTASFPNLGDVDIIKEILSSINY